MKNLNRFIPTFIIGILSISSIALSQNYIDYSIRSDDLYANVTNELLVENIVWTYQVKMSSSSGVGTYSSLITKDDDAEYSSGKTLFLGTSVLKTGTCLDNADNVYVSIKAWEEDGTDNLYDPVWDDEYKADVDYDSNISGNTRGSWVNFNSNDNSGDYANAGTNGATNGEYRVEIDVLWNYTKPVVSNNLVNTSYYSFDINMAPSTYYRVTSWYYQVSTVNTFASTVTTGTISDGSTSTTINGLDPNTTYYVRVRGTNEGGTGNYSSTRSTTTESDETTWNGSAWSNGAPNSEMDVVFSGNYNDGADFVCKNLTINSGQVLTLGASETITVNGNLDNNGTFTIATGSSLINTGASSEFINNGTLNNTGTILLNDITNNSGQSVNVNGGGEMTVNGDLNNSGTFTINSSSETSSGSLIVKGTSTGNIVYNRYITGNKWHLTASPTVGQSISSFLTSSANSIVLSGSDYNAMDYDETVDDWTSHYTSGVSGNFIEGKGYCIKRSSSGTVTFTGTVKTSDVSVAITRDNFGWNMLSNPYPSAIGATSDASSTTNFLGVNAESNLDPSYAGLYVWNQDASEYKIINNSGGTLNQDYLQAGQAFFVKSIEGGGNISITEAMQAHQPTVAFGKANPILPPSSKNAWQTIELIVQTEDNNSSTLIKFKEGMTLGLDVSYDSGQFGVSSELSISTKLLEDNGVDFAIQCLPDNANNMEIPIVLKAESGTEVTFRAETDNLSKDMSVILEDRLLGVFTNLSTHGSSYTETMANSSSEQRFYLHTQEATLSEIDSDLNNRLRVIPQKDLEQLVIIGIEKNSELYIYSLSGKLIKSYLLKSDVENTLDFKGVKTGIYIVRINNIEQIISKKILW